MGDFDGALEDINLALEFESDNYEFHLDKASILFDSENYEAALAEVSDVLKHEPSAEAYRLRALIHLEKMDFEQAVNDFNSALKNGLETEEIYLRRGEALFQLERNAEALDDFRRAKTLAEEGGNAQDAARCEMLIQNLEQSEN